MDSAYEELQASLGELFFMLNKGVRDYGNTQLAIAWVSRALPMVKNATWDLKLLLEKYK